VPVRFRHPEPADGLSLEIELDQHRGLVSHHPPVVPRLDSDDLGSHELQGAAVRILDIDLTAGQEPDVRVHAEIRADDPSGARWRRPAPPHSWFENQLVH
jgi:hypothetical protein